MSIKQLLRRSLIITHPIVKRIIIRLIQYTLKFFKFLNFFINKLTQAVLNERSITEFSKEFGINFGFVLICILFTASVNYIPRPTNQIFYKFLYRFDPYFFDIWQQPIGSITGFLLTCMGAYLINQYYYTHEDIYSLPNHNHNYIPLKPIQISTILQTQSSRPSTSTSGSTTLSPSSDLNCTEEDEIFESTTSTPIPTYYSDFKLNDNIQKPNKWNKIPIILLCCAWIILNILYNFKLPIYKTKNIIAWIFHVPVHFIVPPMIGIWLYIWHEPGTFKIFTFCLGFQNFALILTYLFFPNAPPMFIKIYGDNKIPTFDMIYSDGQASEDKKFSIFLHKAIYYATPHKFASFPSLHSAFACLICFFVCYYSKWSWFKILSVINVFGQWWADLYFDHHWRIDSLAGLIYAILTWTLLNNWQNTLGEIDYKFNKARNNGDFINGSTMGMRLFRNTKLQNFFDPLA
ncbi:uncharacterized protein KGF55_003040 [Candida pseudojiufengensis]|uniref:uncharacterized protein n=1 Tax=Candida pseudojiufengensis TaxID=497109 RepID=UPI002224739B|nr:uncharacterized protein KGF55_003040 [Candida pseudojiufengensis]KAI5963248.1 hypothetical protein KGF55_003040 [Candida pseudojiufengensis]